jgi:hypothetical protein
MFCPGDAFEVTIVRGTPQSKAGSATCWFTQLTWLHRAESWVEATVQAAEVLNQELREPAAEKDTKVGSIQPFSRLAYSYTIAASALTLVSNVFVQSWCIPIVGGLHTL